MELGLVRQVDGVLERALRLGVLKDVEDVPHDVELRASLALVGVREHRSLGFADGTCADVPAYDGEASVAELIAEVEPDTILTFGPDGMTGHPDHRAVSAWTTAAWRASGARARLLHATLTPRFHAE